MLDLRALLRLLALLVIAACSSGLPGGSVRDVGPALPQGQGALELPPSAPLTLNAPRLPKGGTRFRLLLSYDGRTEYQQEGELAQSQQVDETLELELVFLERPVGENGEASQLILEALHHEGQSYPPGVKSELELADDRLRTIVNEEVDIDLRGAQPREDLTPRMLLGRPFALIRRDPSGPVVILRGVPSARRLLRSFPLHDAVQYVLFTRPAAPVQAGSHWSVERHPASPIGEMGLAFPVEQRIVGWERVDGVPCARVSLQSHVETDHFETPAGMVFSRVRVRYEGEALIDLSNHQLYRLTVEDLIAVKHHSSRAAVGATARARYHTRARLERLDTPPERGVWADSTPRFESR